MENAEGAESRFGGHLSNRHAVKGANAGFRRWVECRYGAAVEGAVLSTIHSERQVSFSGKTVIPSGVPRRQLARLGRRYRSQVRATLWASRAVVLPQGASGDQGGIRAVPLIAGLAWAGPPHLWGSRA